MFRLGRNVRFRSVALLRWMRRMCLAFSVERRASLVLEDAQHWRKRCFET